MTSISYDPKTALIVVDVQNDFADASGSLYVRGGETVVPLINDEVSLAQDGGALVVYTADWHPRSTPHFAKDGGIWPVHCVADTWGAEFHRGLVVAGPIVRKGADGQDGYSGFTTRDPTTDRTEPTGLDTLLRDADVTALVVTGLATDYCVKSTVLDGLTLGLSTTVLTDAVRPVDLEPGDGELALDEMKDAGAALV